jgi:hypothetical protein
MNLFVKDFFCEKLSSHKTKYRLVDLTGQIYIGTVLKHDTRPIRLKRNRTAAYL